jgi:abortive infection bacteriophage resistance protein
MKPALTYAEQLALLRKRNLVIGDEAAALDRLRDNNYYRLAGYARPFQIAPGSGGNDDFRPGTTLDVILDLASFDSSLRRLVLQGLESVEVATRAVLAYTIATKRGATAYGESSFYQSKAADIVLNAIDNDLERASEAYLDHHDAKHGPATYPPVWATVEALSFGTLSKMLSGAKSDSIANAVAGRWHLNGEFFKSLIHHFTYVRNVCAHHNRLWNRQLSVKMKDFLSLTHPLYPKMAGSSTESMYRTLVFIDFLSKKLDPTSDFESRLFELINGDKLRANGLGFPSGHRLERF